MFIQYATKCLSVVHSSCPARTHSILTTSHKMLMSMPIYRTAASIQNWNNSGRISRHLKNPRSVSVRAEGQILIGQNCDCMSTACPLQNRSDAVEKSLSVSLKPIVYITVRIATFQRFKISRLFQPCWPTAIVQPLHIKCSSLASHL